MRSGTSCMPASTSSGAPPGHPDLSVALPCIDTRSARQRCCRVLAGGWRGLQAWWAHSLPSRRHSRCWSHHTISNRNCVLACLAVDASTSEGSPCLHCTHLQTRDHRCLTLVCCTARPLRRSSMAIRAAALPGCGRRRDWTRLTARTLTGAQCQKGGMHGPTLRRTGP